ncbi:unnamed protein product [Adineta ricciae]|uniref:Uncharacterized protein n=1 Tax=Adineta ricciae TaxID=249248 RepID=A0A813QQP2_ADIRI|nr:unnamed protein product [Adineta ricciae]CAF1381571.1 unnamed protein product [Adineta ricciae]
MNALFWTALCVGGAILFGIAATVVVSLIPVYTEKNTDALANVKGKAFSMNYSLNSASLASGDLSATQRDVLSAQLSSLIEEKVSVELTSATVKSAASKRRSLFRRQAAQSVVLEIRGAIKGQKGCATRCTLNAVKKFQSLLCTTELLIIQ